MVSTILGRKLGMTQIFDEDDNFVPVTVILAGPCTVSQVKTKETDGYEAVQIGFGSLKPKHVNKPMAGHFAKAGVEPMKYLREVRVDDASQYSCGDKVTVEAFADVKAVDVTGTSKGKGFQGTIKRWNFRMGDATHGNSLSHRAPGSLGQRQTPGRVFPGKKMSGHMGHVTQTTQNLQVVKVDAERGLIAVRGAVPGAPGGDVIVRPTSKGV